MHVCDEYVWSFSDKQLIFVFCHNIKNNLRGFGGVSARAASISCQTYCYSGCEARLEDHSICWLTLMSKEKEDCQIKCELDRN